MFSIIDNEIRVNFEILGGVQVAGSSSQMKSGNTGHTGNSPIMAGTPTATPDAAEFVSGLTPEQLVLLTTALQKLGSTDALVQDLQAAASPLKGGSLDNALSKGIQYSLIGGAVNKIVLDLFSLPKPFWDNLKSTPEGQKLVAHIFALASPSPDSSGEWQPDKNVSGDEYKDITRRDPVSGVLQVNLPTADKKENYVSLQEYYLSGSNAHDRDGRSDVADAFGKNAQHFECFMNGESMWDDKGDLVKPDCAVAIKAKGLWKATAPDIAKMSPKVVFNILKSLGFRGEHTSKGFICQSYGDWRSSLSTTQKDKLGFPANSNQFANADFVQGLVAFINANPAILNKNSADPAGQKPDLYGVHPASWNKRVDHSLDDLRYRINSAYDTVRWRFNGLNGFLPQGFRLFTGGAAPAYLFPANSSQSVENMPKFSVQIQRVYDSFVSRLRAQNKKLGDTTVISIKAIFKSLEDKEKDAIRVVKQLEAYQKTNKLTGNRDHEVVSQKAMDEAYKNFDSLMNKMRKRAINLVDISSVLGQAVRDSESAQSNFGNIN